jgi:hypothetical protein
MTSHRRLLGPNLSPAFVRRTHVISLSVPATMLILMSLVAVGIGRLINPLLLFALVTLCFIVLGVLEWREEGDEPEDTEGQGSVVRKREDGQANGET